MLQERLGKIRDKIFAEGVIAGVTSKFVLNMYRQGLDGETIAKFLGLEVYEVQEILKSQEHKQH